MIIVEGPDGGGKTTLVEALARDTGLPVMGRVVSKDAQAMVDLVDWVEKNVDHGPFRAIYDRHRLVSEPIYGPVLRATLEPGFDDLKWLALMQWKLRIKDPAVIFCLPPFEVVMENLRDDKDNLAIVDRAPLIYWLYFNLAASWQGTLIYDYTQEQWNLPYDQLLERVKLNVFQEDLRAQRPT